ncbi:MAG: hypothetical protein U1C52_01150 [Patescibacteria group bacterium]|nr:hypothetical protein [Patescibacteria group bacterium]
MKHLAQEFIQEKGRELVLISGAIIVILTLAFGYSYFVDGGDPYLPDEFSTLESKVDRELSNGLTITSEATANLNDLLKLELEGKKTEVLAEIGEARAPLAKITSTVTKLAADIESIAALVPQVKPRKAQGILSDAMIDAAVLGQNLLTFSQQMDTLYDGLEARAKGEESNEDYARLVQEVNAQVQGINNLRSRYNAAIDQLYQLTDV